jgi:type IV pilus assembly protein PilN
MPKINLLPWREELRDQRRNEFYISMAGAIGAAAFAVFIGVLIMNGVISQQNGRNQILLEEMKLLDRKIAEIKDLEAKKDRLIARMEIVEQLQKSRPEIVHLFEELVRTLPDGVYLTEVKQSGSALNIAGAAESNTRVSALMRNVDKSGWLTQPDLEVVEVRNNSDKSNALGSLFSIRAKQITILEEDES